MLMAKEYSKFMVFELLETGDRKLLDISEEEFRKNNGEAVLDPTQVLIIVKEGLRRIFIWNGFDSSVRKRFIGSRVASSLQNELMEEFNFHRCKVVSVDQGDEVKEFLKAFNFSPTEIDQERREQKELGIDYKNQSDIPDRTIKQIDIPSLDELKSKSKPSSSHKRSSNPPPSSDVEELTVNKTTIKIPPEINLDNLLETILEKNLNSDYDRKHILLGENILYGPVTKKIQIFGNLKEKQDWEPIKKVPKRVIELNNHKLRIHLNEEKKIVQAIEVLENTQKSEDLDNNRRVKQEKEEKLNKDAKKEKKQEQKQEQDKRLQIKLDFSRWTLNALRKFCSEHDIDIPSSAKKADVIKLAEDYYENL